MRREARKEGEQPAGEERDVHRGDALLSKGARRLDDDGLGPDGYTQRARGDEGGGERRAEDAGSVELGALLAEEGRRGHAAAHRRGVRDEGGPGGGLELGLERSDGRVEDGVRPDLEDIERNALLGGQRHERVEGRVELHGLREPRAPMRRTDALLDLGAHARDERAHGVGGLCRRRQAERWQRGRCL